MYNQSAKGHINPSNHSVNNNAQPQLPAAIGRPSSVRHSSRSEEESDHEYYNELDKLKREMQPLQQSARKNETTV
jgi:epidermal growth factor receptor